MQEQAIRKFTELFSGLPTEVARAPGRVNLIGEHVDYCDGFVLPIAIDRAIWIALRRIQGRMVRVHSAHYDEILSFDLDRVLSPDDNEKEGTDGWLEYLKAVAWALQGAGHELCGWEGVVAGDVPIAAGLASSAALEVATALGFVGASSLNVALPDLALLCQRAENDWVGMKCGIMDQSISALGRRNHAMLLDCQSLDYELVPLPPGTAVVVLDTGTRRGLMDSEYNARRARCEAAAEFFGVTALRDVTVEQFKGREHELDEVTRKRARHVVFEIARTLAAVEAMRQKDARRLGQLMIQSHESLRDDFEVSTTALDTMVNCALEVGCYGARLTGAGFGGCAVALVKADQAQAFADQVAPKYQEATSNKPEIYVCQAANGAEVLPL